MAEKTPNFPPSGASQFSDDSGGPIKTSELTKEGTISDIISPSMEIPDHGAAAANTDEEEEEYITGLKLLVVIIAITLISFLVLLDMSIVATAVPQITSHFHSLPDIGWYGSAYLLASCALQPMSGKLFSRFNTKLGSLLSAVATSSKMFIVGRAVAGMGGSGLFNGGLTIFAACMPLEKRSVYIGILIGISQLGIVLGPLIGGAFTEYVSWRWCFYINIVAGGCAAIFLFFIRIPSHNPRTPAVNGFRSTLKSLDLIGFVLFAPAAIMFLLALQWGGNTYKWNSAEIIGLFCGAGATIVIFFGWEYTRGDAAMIPLPMITKRITALSCLVQFFQSFSMLTTSYYLAIYFQAVRGVSPLISGVHMLPSILSQLLLTIVTGFLVGRLGYYLPWIIAGTILTSIGTGLISTLTPTSVTGAWVGYQIISGLGRGCGFQIPITAMQNNLKPEEIPVGMSLVMFSQTFGGALSLSFAQTIFSTSLVDALLTFAPGMDAKIVINAGAAKIQDSVPEEFLPGVLLAYDRAISHVFYLAVGAIVTAFLLCWGMGWKSVKKQKIVKSEA